jgi:hypothetical protein
VPVAGNGPSAGDIAHLVDHMFSEVLDENERAELLAWIHAWEARNPDVDAAHRVTGWIDVAYAYHSRRNGMPTSEASGLSWGLTVVPAF